MRVSATFVVLALSVPAAVAAAPAGPVAKIPPAGAARECPRTTSYLADAGSVYRGAPLAPRKLAQLPPGTTYMAVYRRIDGCEAPLTMVEYRNFRRR
jgi:hypothetical protein